MNNKPLRSPTRSLWLLPSLAVALVLASCAPAAAPPVVTERRPQVPAAAPTATLTPGQAEPFPPEVAQPSATVTPRGNDLVATDPSTVSLASGGLQLVEFFRFT